MRLWPARLGAPAIAVRELGGGPRELGGGLRELGGGLRELGGGPREPGSGQGPGPGQKPIN